MVGFQGSGTSQIRLPPISRVVIPKAMCSRVPDLAFTVASWSEIVIHSASYPLFILRGPSSKASLRWALWRRRAAAMECPARRTKLMTRFRRPASLEGRPHAHLRAEVTSRTHGQAAR